MGGKLIDSISRAARIRHRVVSLSLRTGSGHLGSSLSVVEILDAVVDVSTLRADTAAAPDRDRLLLSKGHAAMAYYATLEVWGMLETEKLDLYLQNGSALWGHVTKEAQTPAIDYSTGSLGHGLGIAAGHALGYRLKNVSSRVFCVLSDGECDEGSTWEAALFAGHHGLKNLTVLVDYNGLQGLDTCERTVRLEPFAEKWRAFGWDAAEVDGHDGAALRKGLRNAHDRPLALLCRTIKGKGIPCLENTIESHYRAATPGDLASLETQ